MFSSARNALLFRWEMNITYLGLGGYDCADMSDSIENQECFTDAVGIQLTMLSADVILKTREILRAQGNATRDAPKPVSHVFAHYPYMMTSYRKAVLKVGDSISYLTKGSIS